MSLLDSVVGSDERLCEGELCCLGHGRKISALCLLYKIYLRADHLLHEYLHHFVAARNTRASADLCDLAWVIPRCRTDQFSRSCLPVNSSLSVELAGRRMCLVVAFLSSFKSAMKLSLQRA